MGTGMHNPIKNYPLVAFFALAFIISWGLSLFAAPGILPFQVPRVVSSLSGLLYHLGPALAGIIVVARLTGRIGVRELLGSLGKFRAGIEWYAFIILYPLVLRLAAMYFGWWIGGPAPTFFVSGEMGLPQGNPLALALPVFLATFVLTGLAEEIGWRGFALPRLQNRFNALAASLILAVLWAIWHYNPLNFPSIRDIIPWHIGSVAAMTILMTWVYNNTRGSLLIAVLFHTFSNFSDWVIPTSPIVGGSSTTFTVQVVLNLGMALMIVLLFGAEHLRHGPETRVATQESPI